MRRFSNWLEAYIRHTRYSESPDSFHFWTGVATVAGALRRRVWVDQRLYQWTPNFYIIIVGPPGVAAKSTSIRQGLKLLEKVPGVHFGPQSITWQALVAAMERVTEGVEIAGEVHPMSCLTISVSELGTLLKPDDDAFLSALIAMWDGEKGRFTKETLTQGSNSVINPWLNIIGCTTPAWIRANIPATMIGGGLTSRIVFVYGDKKRQLVAYPSLLVTSASYLEEEEHLIHDLIQIGELKGEYHLEPEALEWGDSWYRKLNTARSAHLIGERFDGYISRKQGHLHKLGMVFAAAKRDELTITLDDLIEADVCLTDIENDMRKVFASIGVAPLAQMSNEVLSIIRDAGEIGYQQLWRLCQPSIRLQDFAEALKGGLRAGYIDITQRGNEQFIKYSGPKAGD